MEAEKKEFDIRKELYEWAQAIVPAISVYVLILVFLVRLISVDGHSMEPTLMDGERTIISSLFYTPQRGDIIMFNKKGLFVQGNTTEQPLVKRIIGLSGDVVDINFDTCEVSVNGQALDEPYINEPTSNSSDVVFPLTVPEGCVFVMGDNRTHSLDGRSSVVGMIDTRYILGRVLLRVYPFDKVSTVK